MSEDLDEARAPLLYTDTLEQPLPDEDGVVDRIIASMRHKMEVVARREGHAVRPSHAKSTGLLKGELRVLPGLAPELAQGLFTQPGTYPAVVRLAQGPGEHLSDSVSTHRGMSVKLFGVPGERLPGHDAPTQDWVFATGAAFPQADAAKFLGAMKGLEAATPMPEAAKGAVSLLSRAASAVVHALGGDGPTLAFFGHTKRNPLCDTYYSQAPLRYGAYLCKMAFAPVSPKLTSRLGEMVDTSADPDAFRTAVVDYMRHNAAEFELRVQLCLGGDDMPVEDASAAWPEDQSAYRPVARLVLPAQDAHSPARAAYFNDVLAFRPAHSLAAHRPLGSIMRARLRAYAALSAARHARNGVAEAEPTGVEAIPD